VKLLIVEDEPRMVELLRRGLTEEGHTVTCALDGHAGLEIARSREFDGMILDVMMPKLNGYELAKRLRAERISTPLLMLTAKDSVPDIVHGLDLGTDDYMTKPFSFNELLARLRTIKRRAATPRKATLQVADLTLDPATRQVSRNGANIFLTRREYSLLEHLMHCAGRVVPRQLLIEAVWGVNHEVEDNTLDAFVRLLRQKIDGDGKSKLIHTVRGAGYMIHTESHP
jgi:DNA-binding response OmpR family regulator